MNKLYLVRHGKTSWNDKHLIQGRQNIPLNNLGYSQAQILSKNRIFDSIDICFSSPLLRAIETARILVGDRKNIDAFNIDVWGTINGSKLNADRKCVLRLNLQSYKLNNNLNRLSVKSLIKN